MYSDFEIDLFNINTGEKIESIKCHRNIIAVRSLTLFNYIQANNNQIKNISNTGNTNSLFGRINGTGAHFD